jgi:hypothetical protein
MAFLAILVWTQSAASRPLHRIRLQAAVTRAWAGYVVRTDAQRFTGVRGSWAEPHVVCDRPGSSVAFWVGLGGASVNSAALEQIGTSADCSERALVSHSAWYQLFPAPPVELPLAIRPGDTLSARVAVSGTTVTLALRNASTGAALSAELRMASPETDSAEWIVEAPSTCFATCRQLPLAGFKRVVFTRTAATAGAHTGTIGSAAWANERLGMAIRDGETMAAASSLFADGSSFAVIRYPR